MNKFLIHLGILTTVIAAIAVGCSENSDSPSRPDAIRSVGYHAARVDGRLRYR
jgi:hypothetical protein